MQLSTTPPLMSPEQFRSQVLKNSIGRAAIYELIRSKRLRHIRIGRKILIPASEALDFAARESSSPN